MRVAIRHNPSFVAARIFFVRDGYCDREKTSSIKVNAYLGDEPIERFLMKFAVSSVLAMLVEALYNIVDQALIGRGVGYLGNAVSQTAKEQNVFYSVDLDMKCYGTIWQICQNPSE